MHGPDLVLIIVNDIAVSASFYERIFEWTPSHYAPMGGVHYPTDSVPVILIPESASKSAASGAPRGFGVSMAFQVADIYEVHQRVQDEQAEITLQLGDSGFGQAFTFADPDGNRLTVYSEVSADDDENADS